MTIDRSKTIAYRLQECWAMQPRNLLYMYN